MAPAPAPSGGPLSVGGTSVNADASGPHAPRLDLGGRIGVGGMGEVHLARDTALGRDVAIQRARRPEDEARLLQEAKITALLEHPGIVPIYGSGVDEAGHPYYAMRLIRGRSLQEAWTSAGEPHPRLPLIPRLLDVIDAVAFAHARGVLHLDLKPANVMLGEYGETIVTDWGLAAPAGARWRGGGTPGFMAPEQVEGRAPDPRADVYAVGAILRTLLHPPHGGAGTLPPPALVDIARRATADDPGQRYPDMVALGSDLTAWFDGRPVAAHRYRTREIVLRFIAAWRAPLIVAASALVAITLTLAIGWWRTAVARDRALRAEVAAVRSERAAQEHLEGALLAQMRVAARDGLEAEASVLAAHAVSVAPSPEARGMLARWIDRPSLRLIATEPLGACVHRAVSTDGRYAACADEAGIEHVDRATGARVRLSQRVHRLAFAGTTGLLVALEPGDRLLSWTPGEPVRPLNTPVRQTWTMDSSPRDGRVILNTSSGALVFDARADQHGGYLGCPDPARASAAAEAPDGSLWLACTDGALLRAGDREPAHRLEVRDAAPRVMHATPDGLLALGNPAGDLVLIDPARRAPASPVVRRWSVGSPVKHLHATADHVAALTDDGVLRVFLRDDPGPPLTTIRVGDALLASAADELLVVHDTIDRWALPRVSTPDGWRFEVGLTSVAVDPHGAWLAAGLGDGDVRVIDVPSGSPVARFTSGGVSVKDLALSPDARWLAVAMSGQGPEPILRVADWTPEVWLDQGIHRRNGWLSDGTLLQARYMPGVSAHRADAGWTAPDRLDASCFDLEVRGEEAAALDIRDGVWRLDGAPRALGAIADAQAVAPLGEETLVVTRTALLRLSADGVERARHPFDGIAAELTASPGARWIAIGMTSGEVLVLRADDGATVARLIAHVGRVAAVQFTADDRWLVTGSWDGTARRWSTRAFEAEPDALRAEVDARWGMALEDVLAAMR